MAIDINELITKFQMKQKNMFNYEIMALFQIRKTHINLKCAPKIQKRA